MADRDRHLLALRTAVFVLLFWATLLALMSPLAIIGKAEDWVFLGVFALLGPVAFGGVYWLRIRIQNRKLSISPSWTSLPPAFAARAGIAAGAGIFASMSAVGLFGLATSNGQSLGSSLQIIEGGLLAAITLGMLICRFSAILYMPVVTDGETNEDKLSVLVLLVVLSWIKDIVEEAWRHPFLESVARSTEIMAATLVTMFLAWKVYTTILPEGKNLLRRRKTSCG